MASVGNIPACGNLEKGLRVLNDRLDLSPGFIRNDVAKDTELSAGSPAVQRSCGKCRSASPAKRGRAASQHGIHVGRGASTDFRRRILAAAACGPANYGSRTGAANVPEPRPVAEN